MKAQLSRYDNRADAEAFREGQWGWDTRFDVFVLLASLPGDLGLIAQWMRGQTTWIAGAQADGSVSPFGRLVRDRFESSFLLLTRTSGNVHRLTARLDRFALRRPGDPDVPVPDDGDALTLAYRYTRPSGLALTAEWLELRSKRDLWDEWYGLPRDANETQVRLELSFGFGAT